MKHGNVIKVCLIILTIMFLIAVSSTCRHRLETNQEPDIENEYQKDGTISQLEKEERIVEEIREVESRYLESATYPEDGYTLEATPEKYQPHDEITLECYFTNTEDTIDAENALPLYAHAIMVEKTQIFLNEQRIMASELYCIEGSIKQNEGRISFQVRCVDADNQIIRLTYHQDSKTWMFQLE